MIKIIILFIVLFFKFNFVNSAPDINAKTAILVDYNSDKILYEYEADLKIYPASMTKIMTSIIAFDLLKKNEISMDDKYVISKNAWRMSQSGYSSQFIMVNDEVSVEDLLKGIIIVSGNDSCIALAEGIAGTEENFVYMMNEKAGEIGMENTNFANSSGINHPDNYSTARDIALMSKYLIKNYPNYYKLFEERSFTWDRTGGDPITQSNRNRLLYKNIGVDGIKTGYLAVEKYSLASSMRKETRRLISVISGLDTKQKRTSTSLKLLNWGYRNTDTFEISKSNDTTFEIKTWLGKTKLIKGITKEDVYVTLSKRDSRKLKVFIDYDGPVIAPIKKDQEIAKLKVYKDQELLNETIIFASQDLKKVNFIKSIFNSINYLIWGDV